MNWEFNHAKPQNGAEVLAFRNAIRKRLFPPVARNKKKDVAEVSDVAALAVEPHKRPLWTRFNLRFDSHVTSYLINNLRYRQPKHKALVEIAEELGQTYETLTSKSRKKQVVKWRQYAMWSLKQRFPAASLPEIGRLFGGFDHTTVLHALVKIQGLIDDGKDPLA